MVSSQLPQIWPPWKSNHGHFRSTMIHPILFCLLSPNKNPFPNTKKNWSKVRVDDHPAIRLAVVFGHFRHGNSWCSTRSRRTASRSHGTAAAQGADDGVRSVLADDVRGVDPEIRQLGFVIGIWDLLLSRGKGEGPERLKKYSPTCGFQVKVWYTLKTVSWQCTWHAAWVCM